MKNFYQWFTSKSITLFNYNAFLLYQGYNIYDMEIRQLVLDEIDEYILKLNAIDKASILTRNIELIRKDIILLYVTLLNKNYFNKKSPNYYSEILLGATRVSLYGNENGAASIYPAFYNHKLMAELLYAIHYFITDDAHRQVTLSKAIFKKDYTLTSSALEKAKLELNNAH